MKFCVNCQKKFLSLEIFYTTAGSGGSDYYQVWLECTFCDWSHRSPKNTRPRHIFRVPRLNIARVLVSLVLLDNVLVLASYTGTWWGGSPGYQGRDTEQNLYKWHLINLYEYIVLQCFNVFHN